MKLENVFNRENSQQLWKVKMILIVSLRAAPCFEAWFWLSKWLLEL